MSVHIVTGRPGGGKGVVTVDEVVHELVHGERVIVSSLALELEPWVRRIKRAVGAASYRPELGLRNYLLREYGDDFRVRERVFLLQESEIGEFYLNRGTRRLDAKRDDQGRVISFDEPSDKGVLYVLDEAWRDFGARDWQKTGKGIIFYCAQHRKFGDTVYFVTQNTKQIETAIRQVAQDFWKVTNHGKLKSGFFKQPSIFSIAIYSEAPTGATITPMERKIKRLDKAGLGSCFDTAKGLGVHSQVGADLSEKRSGIPWWGLFAVLIAIAVALVVGVRYGPRGIMNLVLGRGATSEVRVQAVSPAVPTGPISPAGPTGSTNAPAEVVVCTGFMRWGTNVWATLSDGRIFTERELSLATVEEVRLRSGEVFKRGSVPLRGPEYVSPARAEWESSPQLRPTRYRIGSWVSDPRRVWHE